MENETMQQIGAKIWLQMYRVCPASQYLKPKWFIIYTLCLCIKRAYCACSLTGKPKWNRDIINVVDYTCGNQNFRLLEVIIIITLSCLCKNTTGFWQRPIILWNTFGVWTKLGFIQGVIFINITNSVHSSSYDNMSHEEELKNAYTGWNIQRNDQIQTLDILWSVINGHRLYLKGKSCAQDNLYTHRNQYKLVEIYYIPTQDQSMSHLWIRFFFISRPQLLTTTVLSLNCLRTVWFEVSFEPPCFNWNQQHDSFLISNFYCC